MTPSLIIAFGSNLGDRRGWIDQAMQLLKCHFQLIEQSALYQSAPVDYLDQPDFYNQVAEFHLPQETDAYHCLQLLQDIETKLQRTRTIAKGPRTIDLDLILFGSEQIQEAQLVLPHPRWPQRSFVYYPICELKNAALWTPPLLATITAQIPHWSPPLYDLKKIAEAPHR